MSSWRDRRKARVERARSALAQMEADPSERPEGAAHGEMVRELAVRETKRTAKAQLFVYSVIFVVSGWLVQVAITGKAELAGLIGPVAGLLVGWAVFYAVQLWKASHKLAEASDQRERTLLGEAQQRRDEIVVLRDQLDEAWQQHEERRLKLETLLGLRVHLTEFRVAGAHGPSEPVPESVDDWMVNETASILWKNCLGAAGYLARVSSGLAEEFLAVAEAQVGTYRDRTASYRAVNQGVADQLGKALVNTEAQAWLRAGDSTIEEPRIER